VGKVRAPVPGRKGTCSVCTSEHRHKIEIGLTYKVPRSTLARRYGLSDDSVTRHAKNHLTPTMRAAILAAQKPAVVDLEALTRSEEEGLLAQLVHQRGRLQLTVEQAQSLGDTSGVVRAERAITQNLELVAKLLGQLVQHHQVTHASVLVSPDYLKLRQVLVETLRPHKAAALDVGRALAKLEQEAATAIKAKAAKANGVPVLIEGRAEPIGSPPVRSNGGPLPGDPPDTEAAQ
jgi:hypothetical protein